MKKRNKWTKMLCFLRRNGLLSRKTKPNPYFRKRVSSVTLPFAGFTPDYNRAATHIHTLLRNPN